MGWYDWFSGFYDRSLEKLYADARAAAADALQLEPGQVVLDLPCGTGQSFDVVVPRIGDGVLIGMDVSAGMLRKASARAERLGGRVVVGRGDVQTLSLADVEALGGRPDRLLVFLGLTALPDWEASFERLWEILRPGGRCVVVDVHAAQPDFQGKMVNLVARADITRRTWEPLERLGVGYTRHALPSKKEYGGALWLAAADKPT